MSHRYRGHAGFGSKSCGADVVVAAGCHIDVGNIRSLSVVAETAARGANFTRNFNAVAFCFCGNWQQPEVALTSACIVARCLKGWWVVGGAINSNDSDSK